MARKGRLDRGLMQKRDASEKIVWFVRLYHEGKEQRFGSFSTKTAARDFYEKAKQEQKAGRFFPERYQRGGSELIEVTIRHYLDTISVKKDQDSERYFAGWWRERLLGRRLNQLTTQELEGARQDVLATGCTPQRVNRYLAWLRHVLNLAVRDGKLSTNPVTKLKMYREPKGKTRFLSPQEESRLMESLGPLYGPWARLAMLTGLRQMEQFSLRWPHVDLERGLLTLPTTKAGEVQYVHLNDEAIAILRRLESWQISPWVFPSENPATHMDARNFYARVWTPAVQRTGIEWCTWHDLRHTFASRLAMNGATEGTIATLLRHSTTALVKRYAHLSPSHLKAAVEGVANFGKEGREERERAGIAQSGPAWTGETVTRTGIPDRGERPNNAGVLENIGVPDTN